MFFTSIRKCALQRKYEKKKVESSLQATVVASEFVLLRDRWLIWTAHPRSRQVKSISPIPNMEYRIECCPRRQRWSLPLQTRYWLFVAKVFLAKVIPPWGTPFEFHSHQGTHFTGQVCWQICAVWWGLQHFHCTYHPPSSGLAEHTNGIIKTQSAKFVEALQIPWPKTLPLVLLSLRSTPFGTHKLSLFDIVTGSPM